MRVYQLLVFRTCALLLSVAGCVHTDNVLVEPDMECVPGQSCNVSGILGLFKGTPANAAMVTLRDGTCIALALDKETFEGSQSLGGKKVSVSGVGYSPPDMPELLWYEFRGRKVSRGICDRPVAIYVDRITQDR